MMERAIGNENTPPGSELKLACMIGTEMRPTRAPKDSKKGVVRSFTEQSFKGRSMINDGAGKTIDKKTSRAKSFIPKFQRSTRKSEKSKASLNYVTVLAFCSAILLMCVGT